MARGVFVSHASADDRAVAELASFLQQGGFEVWHDDRLVGGQDWWESILEHIRACDVFVFALSPASLASAACALELDYALALDRPLLPVQMADLPPGAAPHERLERIQRIDYRSADQAALSRLLGSLWQLPPSPPLPRPLPPPPGIPAAGPSAGSTPLERVRETLRAERRLSHDELTGLVRLLEAESAHPERLDAVLALLHLARRRPELDLDRDLSAELRRIAVSLTPGPLVDVEVMSRDEQEIELRLHLEEGITQYSVYARVRLRAGTVLVDCGGRSPKPQPGGTATVSTFRTSMFRGGRVLRPKRDEVVFRVTLDDRRERLLRLDVQYLGVRRSVDNTAPPEQTPRWLMRHRSRLVHEDELSSFFADPDGYEDHRTR